MRLRLKSPMNPTREVAQYLIEVLDKLNFSVESVELSSPKNPKFGDLSTNVALLLTKTVGKNPMEIAKEISQAMPADNSIISEISVTPPGFINFKIQSELLSISCTKNY